MLRPCPRRCSLRGRLGCLPLRCSRSIAVAAQYKPDEDVVRKRVAELLDQGCNQDFIRTNFSMEDLIKLEDQILETEPLTPVVEETQSMLRETSWMVAYDALLCITAVSVVSEVSRWAKFDAHYSSLSILAFVICVLFEVVAVWSLLYKLKLFGRSVILRVNVSLTNRSLQDRIVKFEAIKAIASYPSSSDILAKVRRAADCYKRPRHAGKPEAEHQEEGQAGSGKLSTAEALSILFVVQEAQLKHGFSRERFSLSVAELDRIALFFVRYATKERSRLHSSELQELCAATGLDLSESEAKVALQAISKNGNMFIDFNEFVSFWVSPDVATSAAPDAADVATAVQQ